MLNVSIGQSVEIQPDDAADEVVEQCREQLDGLTPRAGIVYSAVHRDHERILQRLAEAFPEAQLMGCSTDGEASSRQKFQEDSLVLTLLASEEVDFGVGVGREVGTDVETAAGQAVSAATQKLDSRPEICITTPESMGTNGVAMVEALRDRLGADFPVFGGVAAHHGIEDETYQFCGTDVYQDALPVLLIGGEELEFSHGCASGWEPIGEEHTVTEAEDDVVYKIDDRTALEFYRRYLGEDAELGPQYPLAIYENEEGFYLRAPAEYDDSDGSVTFFGDVPTGGKVRLTRGPRQSILDGAEASIQNAVDEFDGDEPEAALFFSCNSRNHMLGTSVVEEIESFESMVGADVPISGFYALGEISPLEHQGPSRFHNETFISLLLGTRSSDS